MRRLLNQTKLTLLFANLLVAISGCDDRVAQVAREAADRQAQQNTVMAELNKEVAAGTHELVSADSLARKEVVAVHRDLQSERSRLDIGWSSLDRDRRQIASERRTESTLIGLTTMVGSVLMVVVLLGFCWFVLVAANRTGPSAEAIDLILNEVLDASTITDSSAIRLRSRRHLLEESEGNATPSA